MVDDRTPDQVEAERRARWAALPERIRLADLSTAQAEPRVPLPEEPNADAFRD